MHWQQQQHHCNHHVLYLSLLFNVWYLICNLESHCFPVFVFLNWILLQQVLWAPRYMSLRIESSFIIMFIFGVDDHLVSFNVCTVRVWIFIYLVTGSISPPNGWMTWENMMNYVETFVIKLANTPSKFEKHEFHKSIWTIHWLLSRNCSYFMVLMKQNESNDFWMCSIFASAKLH